MLAQQQAAPSSRAVAAIIPSPPFIAPLQWRAIANLFGTYTPATERRHNPRSTASSLSASDAQRDAAWLRLATAPELAPYRATHGIEIDGTWREYVCQDCCDAAGIPWNAARYFPAPCEQHDPTCCHVCKGVGMLSLGEPCLACATLGEIIPSPTVFAARIIEIQGADRADLASPRWLADAIDQAAHVEQWGRAAWLEVFDAVAYWRDLYMPDATWWDHAARRCLKRITALLAWEVA